VRISKLVYSKKNPKLVNLFIDGKFEASVLVDSVLSMSLKSGDEITEIDLKALKSEAGWQKWIDKILNFISIRPRSRKEVSDYIKKKLLKYKILNIETGLEFANFNDETQSQETKNLGLKNNNDLVESLLSFLSERGYINDVEFAIWFTRQRLTSNNPKGLKYIKRELVSKGVNKNDIEIAFEKLEKECLEYEQNALNKVFLKQVKKYKTKINDPNIKNKIISYLISKGFSYSDIKLKVDEYTKQI